jgi:endonuclease/exonuclease/phosphatase family metal-dependent hydrolase
MDNKGDFNMTKRPEDKSHDCGRAISDLERFTWGGLLNSLQVNDKYLHQGGLRFFWDNGQKGTRRRLARLDRIYTPTQSKLNMHIGTYFIHGYSVGSDHAPVHLELHIDSGIGKKGVFK